MGLADHVKKETRSRSMNPRAGFSLYRLLLFDAVPIGLCDSRSYQSSLPPKLALSSYENVVSHFVQK